MRACMKSEGSERRITVGRNSGPGNYCRSFRCNECLLSPCSMAHRYRERVTNNIDLHRWTVSSVSPPAAACLLRSGRVTASTEQMSLRERERKPLRPEPCPFTPCPSLSSPPLPLLRRVHFRAWRRLAKTAIEGEKVNVSSGKVISAMEKRSYKRAVDSEQLHCFIVMALLKRSLKARLSARKM